MNENWKYIKIEKCLEKVKYTEKIPSSDYKQKGTFPIVSQEEKLISGYWDSKSDVYKVHKPVVVFGDHTRILKYVDFDFVLGADGVKILQPIDTLSARFLLYYLKWYDIPNLGYSRHYKLLKEIDVPIPPISEQERIVAELDLLTGVIEKQKAQLKELDNLAQSIFYDMFGDPAGNEKGWKECIFKDAFRLKSGDNLVEKNFRGGQYPVYGGNGISGYHNEFNKDGRFILIGRVGAYCGNVRYVQGRFWLTDNAFQASFDKEIFDYEYSCMLLNLIDLHQYANHAAQPVISNVGLKDIKIIIPPLQLQQQFSEKIEAIEHQKTLIKKSIEETQKLFDYTMDKYFG